MKNSESQATKTAQHPTIFHEMLKSNLPPEEKSLERLANEAQTIIGAGLETTAWALSIASFHLINSPKILQTLRTELQEAIPDPSTTLDWLQLEKLPYLTGCVQEAIRLSYGISARQPRVSPNSAMKYKNWVIPPNTPVSMTIVDVHHDKHLYPDSHSYIPERWLGSPKTENGSSLNRYFVAFGKDARSCLGVKYARDLFSLPVCSKHIQGKFHARFHADHCVFS
jgi:cytochrome P450